MAFFGTVIIGFGFTYDLPFYFVVVAFLILQAPNILADVCIMYVCVYVMYIYHTLISKIRVQ